MTQPNRIRKWLASPLARRLTIGIILFSSAITLVITAIQIFFEYRYELRNIERELTQVEQVHLRALSQSLWATNSKELNLQLEGMVQTPDIEYAVVREGERIWSQAGAPRSRRAIERSYLLTYDHKQASSQIGTLTVRVSLDNVYGRLIRESLAILLRNAIKTFLVAGFMLFFFHWLVTRHLRAITEFLQRVHPQITPQSLALARKPRATPDEFDALVGSIHELQQRSYDSLQALAESEERFHAIADYTVGWESWLKPDGKLVWVNASVHRLTGLAPAECLAMADYPFPLIAESDVARVRAEFARALQGGFGSNVELRIKHKDGMLSWMVMSWQPIFSRSGQHLGVRASIHEIGERKRLEQQLQAKVTELERFEELQRRMLVQARHEQARMTSLLSAMTIGILFADVDGRVVYYNPAFRRIWLIADNQDLAGRTTSEVMALSCNLLVRPEHFSRHILHILATYDASASFEIVMADGRVVTQLSYPVRDNDDRFIGRLWVYEDVTRERKTAEQLIYLAERDSLTGLHNRHRFQIELDCMLARSERSQCKGALLFFDLDEFKYINDTFGHRAGDSMLIRVAGEVQSLVRRNEVFSRIGGDEFAILMPDATEAEAVQLAERSIRAISQIPFRFEDQSLRLTTSLGIALYPQHGTSADDLVAHADAAMYQAKEAGKNAWRIYRQDLDASREMLTRLSWNDRLSRALEQNLLVLHFQGVYHAKDGALAHLEALVRLQDEKDPQHIIMPGAFIPAAEKTRKILDIDRWVIRESVRQLQQHPQLPAIAVNISGRSFDEPTLPRFIDEVLREAGVDASRLMVELTETSAVSDLQDAQRFIEALRHTGCRVCLDDFGTGFSSFAYLKHLKVDILKIDGLFIRDLPNDRDNQVFVKSIVDVAHGMNKITVAEFVEDAQTLDMLRTFEVDMVQGYYLDKPRANHPALESVREASST